MNLYYLIMSIVIGAIFGSFSNVIIFRYSKPNMNIIKPKKSFCPNCEKHINWYDNIPLVSYILLGGKCRNCSKKISSRYFIVELLSAICYGINYIKFGTSLSFIGSCIIATSLIIVFFIDIDTLTISDWNSIFIAIGGVLIAIDNSAIIQSLGTSIAIFILIIIVYFTSKKGIGMGDILLLSASAIALGIFKIFLAIFIASLGGLLTALFLKKNLKDKIPFGPFITIGVYMALILGDKLISRLW